MCISSCALGTGDPLDDLTKNSDGLFLAVSDTSTVLTSTDGIVWMQMPSTGNNTKMIAYNGITFIGALPASTGFISTLNLQSWIYNNSGAPGFAHDIIALNNTFYLTGYNGAGFQYIYRTDGVTSTTAFSSGQAGTLYSIAYGNNTLVAVGETGPANNVFYSIDGTTWTGVNLPNSWFFKIIFADWYFIAVGRNAGGFPLVVMSLDGISWTGNLNPTTLGVFLYGVTCGNGKYVAVGTSGYVSYSEDGIAWINYQADMTGNNLNSVAYGDGAFIAAGNNGRILYSPNGLVWTPMVNNGAYGNFQGVTYIHNINSSY